MRNIESMWLGKSDLIFGYRTKKYDKRTKEYKKHMESKDKKIKLPSIVSDKTLRKKELKAYGFTGIQSKTTSVTNKRA